MRVQDDLFGMTLVKQPVESRCVFSESSPAGRVCFFPRIRSGLRQYPRC